MNALIPVFADKVALQAEAFWQLPQQTVGASGLNMFTIVYIFSFKLLAREKY
ncbi:MAG: hypothetical protein JO235_21920 [Chroococcidiopsidaceae cyanobacterium CP_BM_RX_35]|nr:hypothetical protein [Chroococcidiopsidaceae cyanobacterium CP_BM_RX_35]